MEKKKIHELKTVSEFFNMTWSRQKTYEIRKNDRDFKIGDMVKLNEILWTSGTCHDNIEYTGRSITGTIIGIFEHPGYVIKDHVILQLDDLHNKSKVKIRKVK